MLARMHLGVDEPTRSLLATQLGVVTRRQLLELGWRAAQIDGSVRRGRLEAVHRGVYRIPGGGIPASQGAMAAVLSLGTSARISGEGVLAWHSLETVNRDAVGIVLVAPPSRPRRTPVGWRPDHLPAHDGVRLGPIPATTAARALVELAWEWDTGRWLATFDACRWRRLVTTRAVLEVAERLGRGRHAGARTVLALRHRGVLEQESPGERRMAEAFAALGFTEGAVVWQAQITPRHRVDALIAAHRLVVEYDGHDFHTDPRDRAADRLRDQELAALGYEVLRVRAQDLRDLRRLRARIDAAIARTRAVVR
jgi:very-short-patch-repair endonuclease